MAFWGHGRWKKGKFTFEIMFMAAGITGKYALKRIRECFLDGMKGEDKNRPFSMKALPSGSKCTACLQTDN